MKPKEMFSGAVFFASLAIWFSPLPFWQCALVQAGLSIFIAIILGILDGAL